MLERASLPLHVAQHIPPPVSVGFEAMARALQLVSRIFKVLPSALFLSHIHVPVGMLESMRAFPFVRFLTDTQVCRRIFYRYIRSCGDTTLLPPISLQHHGSFTEDSCAWFGIAAEF
jgi:hypothetical protein